jgi:hypothetical protein
MRFIRIVLDGNKSYLVYQRGLIQALQPIQPIFGGYRRTTALKRALDQLRADVSEARSALRAQDKLENKDTGAVLRLLREKRRRYADQCLESKKPVSRAKHVGVEIEFVSSHSRRDIALDLAAAGLNSYVELKHDGSVHGESSGDCDGSCREDCECAYCGETHYCDNERECIRRARYSGDERHWEYRDNCQDCEETEYIEDCQCGGIDDETGQYVCNGDHIVCSGHCPGHHCNGYDDHSDFDCQCECTCSNEHGHEIAVVAKSTIIADVIRRVCRVLQAHNAEVNSTCGLHVHLDARGQDEKRMFANLVKSQRLLYSMVPKSRFDNTYCKPNDRGNTMGAYNGRYWGINPASYSEHKTIEVRLHSGSVNADKIVAWVQLLQKIAYAKRVPKVNHLSDVTSHVKLADSLVAYIRERVAKFAAEHGGYSLPVDQPMTVHRLPTYQPAAAMAA